MTLAAVLLLAGTLAAQELPTGPDVVREVRIVGNERLSDNAVLVNVRTRPGDLYNDAIVQADQQRLLGTGQFHRVRAAKTPTEQGVLVTFFVEERPVLGELTFEGNKALETGDLRKVLGFREGSPLEPYSVEKGRTDLLQTYREKGYYFAEITYDPRLLDEGRVVYRIVEGPRVRIRDLEIEGNEYFGNFKLKSEIATRERLWPIIAGFLDAEQLERDVHTLRNLYIREGFLDAEVGRRLEFSPDKKDVELTFVIREGPRYRIDEVVFQGNTLFSDAELVRRMELHPGEFYTAMAVQRDLEALRNTYGELGYIYADIDAARRFQDEPGVVDLVITVRESDQYRLGQVIIRGNPLTQDRVIRREITVYPEQLFNLAAVREAERRLKDSRLFETVNLTPIGQAPGMRELLVEVSEGRTANFMIGVGVSSQQGLLGNISFEQRNFDILAWPGSLRDVLEGRAWKGAGETFRIVAEPGTEMMRFHLDWENPYLFDKPYSLGTQLFLFTRDREKYLESRYGTSVSVGHTFKNRWHGQVSGRVQGVKLDDLESDAAPEILELEGSHLLASVEGALIRSRTDSRWNPSRGDMLRLSVEQTVGDFTFTTAKADYRLYHTLYTDVLDRKHILASRASVGYIFGDAPVFERFYGGGLGSVRGFDYRGISPRSAAVGNDDPIGGEFMVFAGTEYSFPLIQDIIRGAVFLDTGTVESDFEVTTYRAAVGFGIRWIIPFFGPVPFTFDFAWPLSQDDEDDTQVFSFTFGWTF